MTLDIFQVGNQSDLLPTEFCVWPPSRQTDSHTQLIKVVSNTYPIKGEIRVNEFTIAVQ